MGRKGSRGYLWMMPGWSPLHWERVGRQLNEFTSGTEENKMVGEQKEVSYFKRENPRLTRSMSCPVQSYKKPSFLVRYTLDRTVGLKVRQSWQGSRKAFGEPKSKSLRASSGKHKQ